MASVQQEAIHKLGQRVGAVVLGVVGLGVVGWSTAIYVADDQGGVIVVKFGADMEPGQIISTTGAKGPQARVLPPGWHFFYWPWLYDLQSVPILEVPDEQIGVITANDGQPLPKDTVYAPEWESGDMLNAEYFLAENRGYKGPQLTVLKPGKYRYNPRLFAITNKPRLDVDIGEVAVIKANAGPEYVPAVGETVETVNGTKIVPKDYRGIWSEALGPNAYYMHPEAYVVTRVKTTNRVYEYADQEAIAVRTKDGFEFPVDVRVSVKITAQNAPYVVAKLANPDGQDGQFTVLEQRVILPLVRAIFRNTAEDRGALEFVNQRSEIEQIATEKLRAGLAEYKVESDGVYVADIRIADTDAGRKLLMTQTDREVAVQEQATYREQQRAQVARAEAVRAQEEADQERQQAQARSRVVVASEDAKAMIAKAEGEAQAYQLKIESLGGVENFVMLEVIERLVQRWDGNLPRIYSGGGGDGAMPGNLEALIGTMLRRELAAEENTKR